MRSSSWVRAAPSPAWTRHRQPCTSTAATASGQWATRAGFVTGTNAAVPFFFWELCLHIDMWLCTELSLGWDQLLPGVSMAFSSVIPVFTATSSQYTEFYLYSDMNQPLTRALHLSTRCHQCASVCAVCHHVVKGLFVWCQGCSHGGHLEHIMSWLKSSAHCPAGCGHLCEYTWEHHDHRSHSWCSLGVVNGPHAGLDHTHTNTQNTGQWDVLIPPRGPGVFYHRGKKDVSVCLKWD